MVDFRGLWPQSFTQGAHKNLICDRKKTYTPSVGAYRRVSFFQDRTEDIEVPIVGYTFLKSVKINLNLTSKDKDQQF